MIGSSDRNVAAARERPDRYVLSHEVGASLLSLASWFGVDSHGCHPVVDDEEVDALLRHDAFAFLIGVLSDYGVQADRAWRVPLRLQERLGHLSPVTMALNPGSTRRAFVDRPPLHRFPRAVASFVLAAARKITHAYGGDAATIWSTTTDARLVQQRLDEFPGIGQKKSAMAVGLLMRSLNVPLDASGSDVAFDVHVRRVFLRSGIAELDTESALVEAARRIHPEHPGVLDYPAWYIGRMWCRPKQPRCLSCPLSPVCAQRIRFASAVRGA